MLQWKAANKSSNKKYTAAEMEFMRRITKYVRR
jgi:hypothetical protein